MTFQDIFKSSVRENIASISMLDMVLALVLAFLLGPVSYTHLDVYKRQDMDGAFSHRIPLQTEQDEGKFYPFVHAAAVAGIAEPVFREIHALDQRRA